MLVQVWPSGGVSEGMAGLVKLPLAPQLPLASLRLS
jgi:hypothetical protein